MCARHPLDMGGTLQTAERSEQRLAATFPHPGHITPNLSQHRCLINGSLDVVRFPSHAPLSRVLPSTAAPA